MIRKPNSIIVLLFIQNNSQFKNIAKTCLPLSMLSSSSTEHVQGCSAPQIFSKQQMSPFELSSYCSCHIFSYYFAQFFLLKRHFCCHNQNNSASSPVLLGQRCINLQESCTVIIRSHRPQPLRTPHELYTTLFSPFLIRVKQCPLQIRVKRCLYR